jgi:hypothetical protein
MHHGIDLGDGTVVHYLEGKQILRSPIDEFSLGEPLQVVPHNDADPVGVTLRRAMGRLGEERYNLLLNNCEHFAVWCKTGKHRSSQVEKALGYGQMLWEQGLNIKQDLNIRAGLSELKKGLKELEQTRVQLSEQTFAEQLQAVENLKNRLQDLLKRSPKPD